MAPAPAKPSRIPAVAMIPSFATAVHDRSDASSVSTSWIEARRSRGGAADAASAGSVVTRRCYGATCRARAPTRADGGGGPGVVTGDQASASGASMRSRSASVVCQLRIVIDL